MAHEAEAAGIIAPSSGTDPAADGRLTASAVGRLVETVTAGVTVTRREVRGYYVRNGDRYRRREARRVRHILLPDAMTTRDAIRRLDAGADMAELAEEISIDAGTRTRGGVLGDVHRGELSGPLEEAIFSAWVGTVFGPIRTEHGWHVARVDAASAPHRPKFLHAGPGFGGSCFPKDTRALVKIAQDHDVQLRIVEAVLGVNDIRKRAMARKVLNVVGGLRGKTVAVLGLTFKPDTDDMREAPSIPLVTGLLDMGAKVRAHDPVGMEQAQQGIA